MNRVTVTSAVFIRFGSKASMVFEKNDVLVIRTAGGGGYGKKE